MNRMKRFEIIKSLVFVAIISSMILTWKSIMTHQPTDENDVDVTAYLSSLSHHSEQNHGPKTPDGWPIQIVANQEHELQSLTQTTTDQSTWNPGRSIIEEKVIKMNKIGSDTTITIPVINGTDMASNAIDNKQGKDDWFPGAKTLSLTLTPLRPMDREFYTIRMNTWQRHQQLIASIKHHSRCEGVAQIQVIWQESGDPPKEVVENPKVVIEKHTENKLNQRFNILIPTPTLGILSVDDDVLYPCEAVDVAFHAWTKNPERQVGFDRRNHSVRKDGRWKV